jgi:hypothetical protein
VEVLIVRYARQRPHDDPEQAPQFLAGAEKIAELPGLVWKLWTYDDEAKLGLNVYLFETANDARAWGDGPLRGALESYDGVGDIETTYLTVDEALSGVTRAPLVMPPAAL